MRRKSGKCVKKGEKCVKKGENHSDPIYTNPIKNLPVVNYYAIVFLLRPPYSLRCEPLFEGKNCLQTAGKLCQCRGRHSKSLCDSKLTLPARIITRCCNTHFFLFSLQN